MATNGAQEAVFIALQAVLDPGDELLIGDPHYTVYDEIGGLLGAKVIPVRSIPEQGFAYDIDAMAAAITPRTKAIALVSPDNPTGAVQTPETLARIAELATEHDLLVISDEIYERVRLRRRTATSASPPCPACGSGRSRSAASRRPTP